MTDKTKSESTDIIDSNEYHFGGITEYNLEEIENEVLNDSVYLDVFAGSDVNFKENIKPVENVLPKLADLNTISFNYKTTEFADKNFPESEQIGLIAQDVEKCFPRLVKQDCDGNRYVNYQSLGPILLQGIKELKGIVGQQGQEIEELKNALAKERS